MNSGFTQQQFEILGAVGGTSAKGPQAGQAYDILKQAHYATRDWADNLKRTLFPEGKVKARRAPINQGGNFTPYTWAKIYPYARAPESLAITVGIDQDQSFIVKIDTVDTLGDLRKRYEAIRGPANDGSPIARVLPAAQGLAMSRDELTAWSAAAIQDFGHSYDAVVDLLGIAPPMRFETNPALALAGFEAWREALLAGALARSRRYWVPEGNIVVDKPHRNSKGQMVVAMSSDPASAAHAVSIIETRNPGTRNPLSNIANDYRGRRYLMHQAKLSGAGANILKEQFLVRTGLTPVPVDVSRDDADRAWLVVAEIDANPAELKVSTGRFVHYCALARSGRANPHSLFADQPPAAVTGIAPGEVGGSYIIGARPAMDERTVWRRHGIVSMTLETLLHTHGIVMRKPNHPLGFETDGEVLRKHGVPLLLEIKTSISAADIHAGIGQLHFYSRLISDLEHHQRVLLLPRLPHDDVVTAIEACGILVHEFSLAATEDGGEASFSDAFLALCGAPPAASA